MVALVTPLNSSLPTSSISSSEKAAGLTPLTTRLSIRRPVRSVMFAMPKSAKGTTTRCQPTVAGTVMGAASRAMPPREAATCRGGGVEVPAFTQNARAAKPSSERAEQVSERPLPLPELIEMAFVPRRTGLVLVREVPLGLASVQPLSSVSA